MAHTCDFVPRGDLLFVCDGCGASHQCGTDRCEHLFFNQDFTSVCRLTGLCFEQRQCEAYIDAEKGLVNIEVPTYHPRVKRDQQVKNRAMDYNYIFRLISLMDFPTPCAPEEIRTLVNQICELWCEFVSCAKEKEVFIRRKDKRSFVVAVIFSLPDGLCSPAGPVVMSHPQFGPWKLNKKKNYEGFKVSDIRYGQKLIMGMFEAHAPANVVCIK
jgi:hypothetical protein